MIRYADTLVGMRIQKAYLRVFAELKTVFQMGGQSMTDRFPRFLLSFEERIVLCHEAGTDIQSHPISQPAIMIWCYGWTNYLRQLKTGEHYELLQPVYSLNLVNVISELELGNEFYHYYRLVHVEHTDKVIDGLHLIFVELPKFTPPTITPTRIRNSGTSSVWKKHSSARRKEKANSTDWKKEWKKDLNRGLEQGRTETRIEMARKMKEAHLPLVVIAQFTGLPEKGVNAL